MNNKFLAFFGAVAVAVALWNAQPALADQDVAQAAPAPAASPSPTPAPKPFQYGGFVDAGFTSAQFYLKNTSPALALPQQFVGSILGANITPEYVFDYRDTQVQLHNFNLQASYAGPIGGKVELSLGDDANVINSYPKNLFDGPTAAMPNQFITNGPGADLTQAYLSLASGQFTLIAGKFETLAGAEVIEAPSNMNFSRSILFGYAVPFTHTGGRLTWAATSTLSLIVGANKGWDTTSSLSSPANQAGVGGPNDTSALTMEFGGAWNPSKAFSLTAQGYTGQVEEALQYFNFPGARPNRSLIDVVATWHFNSALTFVLNGDSGSQTNTVVNPATGAFTNTATWSGVAGYANYAFNSQWSVTGRVEYFADYGGYRTGINGLRWGEGTATLQYAPNANVMIRAELRGDETNQPFFAYTTPTALNLSRYNRQLGIETVVKWP